MFGVPHNWEKRENGHLVKKNTFEKQVYENLVKNVCKEGNLTTTEGEKEEEVENRDDGKK